MADMGGIFNTKEVQGKRAADVASGERRVKLKAYDATASQLLSIINSMDTRKLWKAVAEGNKSAAFHTELSASTDTPSSVYRVGVGLSRTAQALLAGIAALEDEDMAKILLPNFRDEALKEATDLKVHLEIPNAGKGSETTALSHGGFAAARYQNVAGAPAQRAKIDIEKAGTALHEFWTEKNSTLRGVLFLLSGQGAFFAAHVAEKQARAWVDHKPATEADVIAAAVARTGASGAAATSSAGAREADLAGLFG